MGCHIFKKPEHALGAAFANGTDVSAFLQYFSRDIQRQIGGVHHTLNKTQVIGKQLLGVVHDEDPLNVELKTMPALTVIEIERSLCRNVKQLNVFGTSLNAVMGVGQGIVKAMGKAFIKLFVLLLGNL